MLLGVEAGRGRSGFEREYVGVLIWFEFGYVDNEDDVVLSISII